MRRQPVIPQTIAAISLAIAIFVPPLANSQSEILDKHLRDQFQDKTFLIRGFYSGNHLQYDSSGAPVGNPAIGDWTTDGFVLVNDIQVSGHALKVTAKRLSVVLRQKGGTFQFLADTPEVQKKKPVLRIEAELPQVRPSFEQADAILSRIFLTAQANFAESLPDYWRTCVARGLSGEDSMCTFSPEFGSIPGFASQRQSIATRPVAAGVVSGAILDGPVFKVGRGVSPPNAIFQQDPAFSEAARLAKFQGTVTLGLIVNQDGIPTKIRILSPIGCGLDQKAVEAVKAWIFEPGMKDGRPVRVELAVQVDFHRY